MSGKTTISIRMDNDVLRRIEEGVKSGRYKSRTHAIELGLERELGATPIVRAFEREYGNYWGMSPSGVQRAIYILWKSRLVAAERMLGTRTKEDLSASCIIDHCSEEIEVLEHFVDKAILQIEEELSPKWGEMS